MSKFWSAQGSSSESEKGSGSDSDEETQNQKVTGGGGKFVGAYESDSESEDEVRVVHSKKDRSWNSMRDSIKRMRSAMKINDWSIILDEFRVTNKIIDNSKMLILTHGIPKFYIKMLADLEDFLNVSLKDKEGMKKMKKEVAKSFNKMKLDLRKHNKTYETQIVACRANPSEYVEESSESESESESEESESESSESSEASSEASEQSSEESESEDDDKPAVKPPAAKPAASKPASSKPKPKDSDSDEDSWPADEDESSSDSSDEEDGRPQLKGRAKWLKATVDTTALDKKQAKKQAKQIANKEQEKIRNSAHVPSHVSSKPKPALRVENLSEEELDKRVAELVASRGRKGTDPKAVLLQLEVLSKSAQAYGPRKEIPVLSHLISAMFDANRTLDDYMDLRTWRTCRSCLMRIVSLLEHNKQITLGVISSEDITDLVMGGQIQSNFIKQDAPAEKSNPNEVRLVGSLENYLIRLEDEYTKSLQQINPHTQDYVVRLSDEALLLELAEKMQKYYLRVGDTRAAAHVALLRVEHLYYKHDKMSLEVRRAYLFTLKWGKYSDLHPACTGKTSNEMLGNNKDFTKIHPAASKGNPTVAIPLDFKPSEDMENLCTFIFKTGDDRSKTRALLCAVYYHAMHDNYARARDLFLISHIQDNIDKADTSTQILYNRALVTLGLSAFRQGLIQKAYECLAGVCSSRVRELLAQGTARWHDKDQDQENAERRRQIPYHMHINHDLLECCFLICAMIIELPHLVGRQSDRNTPQKYYFRKHLQSYNRQVFTGPPENTREHVLAAAKALLAGEWTKASQYILNLDVWSLIPGSDGGHKIKAMLSVRLKEEALRIYLLSSISAHYQSISLEHACQQFEMDAVTARRVISKMIYRSEIAGAWDQTPEGKPFLVIYNVEPTPAQMLALQMADKVTNLLESNERLLDPLTGSYGYKEDWSANRKQFPSGSAETQTGPGATSAQRGGRTFKGPAQKRDAKDVGGMRAQPVSGTGVSRASRGRVSGGSSQSSSTPSSNSTGGNWGGQGQAAQSSRTPTSSKQPTNSNPQSQQASSLPKKSSVGWAN